MKVILVNQRHGHTRTFVISGWLKGLLSLCLLGAPVALGYLGYQLSVLQADPPLYSQAAPQKLAPSLALHDSGPLGDAQLIEAERDSAQTAAASAFSLRTPDPRLPMPAAAPVPQPSMMVYRHGRIIDPLSYRLRTYS